MAEESSAEQKKEMAPTIAAGRRRRLAIRLGIGAGVLLILFLLVVFVLPTPLARYVIESQLEDLGIQHDGIDTVDIDLWNSEVRAGPVTFRSGEAQRGQIGETGFDYSFGELFQGHAFVRVFYLRGVDVYVTRRPDGAIEINGINLRELAGSDEAAAEPSETEAEDQGDGFGFGGESFEFSDSLLVFEDHSGGTLTMELERLTLERLRSWTPEEPTAFALEARLNEIGLSLDGTVVPLGDPLLVKVNTRVTGATLDRLARFIGPTGLALQNGSLSTEVHYDYAIHRDGRVDGKVDGTYRFEGFDIATETGETVTLDAAALKVNLTQDLRADGTAGATGQATLTGGPLAFANAAGDALDVAALEVSFDGLNMSKGLEQRERVWQAVETARAAASESVPSVVELLIGWARDLGQDALLHEFSIDLQPRVTLTDARLRSAARDGQPGHDLRLEEARLSLGAVTSEGFNAGWRAQGGLEAAISGLSHALQDGSAEATLAAVNVNSQAVDFVITREETRLGFDLAVALEQLGARNAEGGSLDLQRLTLASEGFTIQETAEMEEAVGPLSLGLEGVAARLPGDGGDLTLRGDSLRLSLSPLTLAGKQGEAARLDGRLDLTGLTLERGGETPLTLSLASLENALQAIRVAPLNAQAAVEGDLATTLSGLELTTGEGGAAVSLSLARIDNQATRLQAAGFDSGAPAISLANDTTLSQLTARLPLGPDETVEATVAEVQLPLTSLSVTSEGVAARGGLEVSGIAARSDGETPQSLDLAGVSVTGLDADSAGTVAAERLALGRLEAKLALPLPGQTGEPGSAPAAPEAAAPETAPEGAPAPAAESAPAEPLHFDRPFRLGEFTLAPGSTLEIRDRSVEPPLQAQVVVEELRAGPIDTAAPESRTDLALGLSVDETSKLRLEGWAAPLKAQPDFELTSQVERLALPVLSPYAAEATGVNVESGELFADIEAKSAAGALGGGIDLKINDLFVTPLSEEQAEKLQADIGLPVGFAVSILKDAEGVIAFKMPLGGTVDAPQVDYSEAIDKAIAGAMASVFPTSWFGPDGNTFQMQPAPFVPGTAELTEAGREVAGQMGELFAAKPGISIRACGRAGRADLVVLRGGDPSELPELSGEPPAPHAPTEASAEASPETAGEPLPPAAAEPAFEIDPPSDEEVQALLALAKERGTAVRDHLQSEFGIDSAQIPECRTAYSIKDGKPPRAEFQF